MRKLSARTLYVQTILLFAFGIFSLNCSAATSTTRYTTGYAYDLNSDKLLYTESHKETFDGETLRSSQVTYRSADGATIASKNLNFSTNPFLPDFRLDDTQTGYVEGLTKQGNDISLFTRNAFHDPLEEKQRKTTQPAVADAGFNLFIEDNWNDLLAGKTVKFNFAVPSKHDYFRFRADKIKDSEYKGRPAAVVQIKVATALLGLLVDPIDVTYDLQTRKLVEYRGLSNIKDPHGENYLTRIVYALDEIDAAAPTIALK